MTTNICDIEKLVQLFSAVNEENNDNDEDFHSSRAHVGNDINFHLNENKQTPKSSKTDQKVNPYTQLEPPKRQEVLNSEVNAPDDDFESYFDQTSGNCSNKTNWKKVPKWDISYRQSVSACDAFLGMSLKNPSTSSCENMVVTINLPGENRQNMDLKIEKQEIILVSPKFYLNMKLPHPVDPKRGNAQWNRDEEKLIVILVMDRELDLINF